MASAWLPGTKSIRAIVSEEVAQAGGRVSDCWEDGTRLFLRSILPGVGEVRPKDRIQGGVAVMTCGEEINVHPYTFRQICCNGAIMARTIETLQVARVDSEATPFAVHQSEGELREAVRACLRPEVFTVSMDQMRAAGNQNVDLALNLLSSLTRLSSDAVASLLPEILTRFVKDRDRSVYGLMNAVTSVARDQSDPLLRWRLEELGGYVPARVLPLPNLSAARQLAEV